MISNFPVTFFCTFDGDDSTQEWENLRLLRDVSVNIGQYTAEIFPGFYEEKGKAMEKKEVEMMFPEYAVPNEENVLEQPIFTSLSRCSSLTTLDGYYSDYFIKEEESIPSQFPKIKSVNLIYSPMKDSGIELDPSHGFATGSKDNGASKKRNRNYQTPHSSHKESNESENKRRKVASRKTERVCTYSRKQKNNIPVDQPVQLLNSDASESKAKVSPKKTQQNEEASSLLNINKRKQTSKQVKEIPAVNSSQIPQSTSQKRKQPPLNEESQPEKRVKKSMSKRQCHC
ncbi:hypothetical protein HMI54_007749 [Coelomomyces lativittatus]|nr:hypothetical protein HMI54_007749 [Coelomomyces lativittatus]